MSKLWPFANEAKQKVHALESQIKNLQTQIDEDGDLDFSIKALEEKVYNESDSVPVLGSFGVVDEYLDKQQLQRLYCTETWFFIAVNAIATDIASLPIKLEKRKLTRQSIQQQDGTYDKISRETWIDASGEPEFKTLQKPNSLQTPMEFWVLVVIDLMATGDAYIYVDKGSPEEDQLEDNNELRRRLGQAINREKTTDVRGMYRLSSSMIHPIAGTEDRRVLEGYGLQTDAGYYTFKAEEIIHIKLPNPSDPFFGLAPIIAVMKNLLLDRYTAEHMLRFYKQGARLGGIIKTQKKLTKEQLIRLERVFESNFTGKRNHHKTLVLPEGMEYQTIEQNPGETALIEFLKANKEPILAAYKVPPIKVGLLDGATYANAMIQDATYWQNTVKPILTYLEQSINNHPAVLNPFKELRMKFDLSGIASLAEDVKVLAQSAASLKDSGMSVNEIREKIWKLGPVEGGEVIPLIEMSKPPTPFIPFGKSTPQIEQKTEVPNVQNDTAVLSDVKPTNISFAERVGQIIAVSVAAGIDPALATQEAIQTALNEGLLPEKVEVPGTEKKWGIFTESQVKEHAKQLTGEEVAPLIETYQGEVHQLFNRIEKLFLKKVKSFVRTPAYKTKADNSDFLTMDEMDLFVDGEIETYTKAQWAAMRKGYTTTLSDTSLTFPNERAQKILSDIGTQHLKSIVGTARDRVKAILVDAYANQESVTEITSLIRDEFTDMKASKANMIARTETLTAVSVGQRTKVDEFKIQFPQEAKRMKKVWITAGDDNVRDSHQDLDGITIGVDEKFDNGLLYPRDPDGDASEVINCRCTSIEYLAEDEGEVYSELADNSPLADATSEAEKTMVKIERGSNESYDDCVSRGIAALINEGKDPEQAAAIAYSMCEIKTITSSDRLKKAIAHKIKSKQTCN
jgi:HK97 family phage portal protein